MKFLFIPLFMVMNIIGYAQHKESKIHDMNKEIQETHQKVDSSLKELDSLNEQLNNGYKKTMDSIYDHLETERNNRNLDMFLQMQKEREAKQKKEAYLRIGLGVLFLGILVFGLMRRRKKPANK